MKRTLKEKMRPFLVILLAVAAAIYVRDSIDLNHSAAKIPGVVPAGFQVFYGEMGKASLISQIDVSEEHIYIAYSRQGVIAVYNWNGEYQYSIAFYSDTNGALGMRFEDGLLHVSDYAANEIILSGIELYASHAQPDTPHLVGWFREKKELPLVIKNGKIYDLNNNFIMSLPGHM